MRSRWVLLCVTLWCVCVSGAALAQTPVSRQAEAALTALQDASLRLEAATKARDRVRALTATVHAFEDGLAALREGLRQAAIQEAVLQERLATQEAEIADLLAVLQSMARQGSPDVLLHPEGPVGTARAAMILTELTPALQTRAREVRADVDRVTRLRDLQEAAAGQMSQGLTDIQTARAALNQAMADRTDLPERFTADPTRMAILLASADTLGDFAAGLGRVVVDETAPPLALEISPGSLPLPVQGRLLRAAGEADAAGVVRPGILLATRAQALVTAPSASTIRFVGPLLDFGQVVILEPRAQDLIVLAGLTETYGRAGQVIAAGTPVGLMGGPAAASENRSPIGDGAGTDRTETLYIEVRENNRPVDPTKWFALGPE